MDLDELRAKIRDIKDFPTEGILFKDITTLLRDGPAWAAVIDHLAIHEDAVTPGQRVLVVDDLLATGGTMAATLRLIARLGGTVIGAAFLIELAFLKGRARLAGQRIDSLIVYE